MRYNKYIVIFSFRMLLGHGSILPSIVIINCYNHLVLFFGLNAYQLRFLKTRNAKHIQRKLWKTSNTQRRDGVVLHVLLWIVLHDISLLRLSHIIKQQEEELWISLQITWIFLPFYRKGYEVFVLRFNSLINRCSNACIYMKGNKYLYERKGY